jgi:hypothetical protein
MMILHYSSRNVFDDDPQWFEIIQRVCPDFKVEHTINHGLIWVGLSTTVAAVYNGMLLRKNLPIVRRSFILTTGELIVIQLCWAVPVVVGCLYMISLFMPKFEDSVTQALIMTWLLPVHLMWVTLFGLNDWLMFKTGAFCCKRNKPMKGDNDFFRF